MSKSKRKKIGISLISIGLLAMVTAGALQVSNRVEENTAAKVSESTVEILQDRILQQDSIFKKSVESQPTEDSTLVVETEATIEIDGENYIGILSIPALQLKWPVNSSWSESKLKLTPCRYSGSVEDNSLAIAAHNYKDHFAGLSKLQAGDVVVFTTTDGTMYRYCVEEIGTIEPTNIASVTNNGYDLSLFTCTYGGSARIVVKCNLIRG